MKRLDQKVKDIVDVRASAGLGDFYADPAATLKGYHFTDITADLMAKWIGQIADVKKGRGAASALAGFRGVGKSHFLASLSAIVSQPELRTKITDTHVMSTAQRLSRRHGVVAHLQRGSSNSLLAELKSAVAEVTGNSDLSDSLSEILLAATEKCGEMPLVLLIDTALGRETRVTRDDGALLSDIAAAAVVHGIFVGIALDDDIAGADGINSSIASNFTIDYLDQEHLYKVVNTHIFPKKEQMRPVLHDIFESYRKAMPGFRWSEHRFSSLYPMHPAILELAPFIRLYLHDFALLGFAVEAGLRILGRPANSLIGLEEVFDSAEIRLRNIHDLKDAFVAYDALDRSVVAKAQVTKRHEAKLILKGFFLMSFTGEGVTATELASATMAFDETSAETGTSTVESLLKAFSDAAPDAINRTAGPNRETKFSLKISGREDLNTVLAESIKSVPDDAVESVLRRLTAEKFSDFDISDDGSMIWATCYTIWRGGIRPGEVIWLSQGAPLPDPDDTGNWKVFIRYGSGSESKPHDYSWPACGWELGGLTADDADTIRRFHVLQTDTKLRETFRDTISTMLHAHSMALEKIWHRVFLEAGRLIASGTDYTFSEEAKTSYNLAQLLTNMLEDQLEKQFPSHPVFPEMLGEKEVSSLTEHLFSGSGNTDPEIQKLAANFALPLGLVYENGGSYVPFASDSLSGSEIVKGFLDVKGLDEREVVPLDEVSRQMRSAPYGLTSEAQHLVLAALVAQRQFEFVTSSENRINHRSLDLQIIWEDIVGIAKPSADAYSGDRLLVWAALLTGDSSLNELKPNEARLKAAAVLPDWLSEWEKSDVIAKIDALPDEKLNSKLWRSASNVKKTFGTVAQNVSAMLKDNTPIDKCLQTIADVFADSEEEFANKYRDLSKLQSSISNFAELDEISGYLTLCGPIGEPELDEARSWLMDAVAAGYFEDRDPTVGEFANRWNSFKEGYADLYIERHDAARVAGRDNRELNGFLGRDEWTTFAGLSEIQWFGRHDMELAMTKIRELRIVECDADVRKVLAKRPFCDCSFTLANSTDADSRIADLAYTVVQGLDYFRQKLLAEQSAIYLALGAMEKRHQNPEMLSTVRDLVPSLESNSEFPALTASQLHVLKHATRELDASGPLHSDRRRSNVETFAGLHPDDFRELENELDSLAGLNI